MPRAAPTQPACFAQHQTRPPTAGDRPRERLSGPAGGAGWSTHIVRSPRGVEVTVRGRIDRPAAMLLDQLLMDLVVGQGNRVVTVHAQELVGAGASDMGFTRVARAARARGTRFTVADGPPRGEGRSR